MSAELALRDELVPAKRNTFLSPVMSLQTANSRLAEFQAFVAGYLQESQDGGQDGGDYGVIPGAGKKKVLLKSGADKLCEIYGIYDEYEIESHENFETNLFFYRVKCILKSRHDDSVVGSGLGACSTYESKYRYRDSQRKCPHCGASAIIKGKDFKGDGRPTGWLCFGKKGGCGAKFQDGDASVEGQILGRIENPDILDTVNTVLKMAKKRAKIDAVIGVTRSSGIFTQDLEETPGERATPSVPVTTEDIPLTKSSGDVKGNASGTAAIPQPPEAPEDAPQPGPDDTIDGGRQTNLHISFRDAFKNPEAKKNADTWLEQWLKNKGYIGKDGKGTSTTIAMADFETVKREAVKWAASQK